MDNDRIPGELGTIDDPSVRERLRRFTWRQCRWSFSASTCEDIFQDACLRLIKGNKKAGQNRPFNTKHLWKTVHNVRREFWRKKISKTSKELSFTEAESKRSLQDPLISPLEQASANKIGDAIRQCLQELNKDYRVAVSLKLAGFMIPEIAQQLGWSRKSAENRVFRGIRQLRVELKKIGVEP